MASGDLVPPTSQIPGLSHLPDDDDYDKKKNYIRESDSEYVKLAKQGGIKGLLSIDKPSDASKEAVPYPKSEWFGHHAMEEADQQKILAERKWKAPDYMTHEEEHREKEIEKLANPKDNKDNSRTLTAREERILIKAKYNNREVPFQSDNLSCWERKEDEVPRRSRFHK